MKNIKLIVLSTFLLVFSLGMLSIKTEVHAESTNQNGINRYEYNIKRLKRTSFGNIYNTFNKKKKRTVFFGFKECPYCQKFSYQIKKISKKHTIYYMNIDNIKNNANVMEKMIHTFNIREFPTIETFKKHKITSKLVGSKSNINNLKF